LDVDASQIVAAKREAHKTYKNEKGYMPMLGPLAENGLIVHEEFREGINPTIKTRLHWC